jgi:hypothetical protein
MIYWLPIVLSLLIIIIIASYYQRRITNSKKLNKIKERWGKPQNMHRSFKLIAGYLRSNAGENISAGTASDLDVDDVFTYIDRTSSKPGQQYLYQKLYSPQIDEGYFTHLEQRITQLNENQQLRELTQLKLSELSSNDAYYLPELFSKIHLSIFNKAITFYIRIAPLIIVALVTSLFYVPNQYCLLLLLALLIANVIIHYSNKTKMLSYTHSLPQLLILNNVAQWLAGKDLLQKSDIISQSLINVARLKKSLSFINIQNKVTNDPSDIAYLLSEWLKMFLLIEPLVFIFSISRVNKYLDDIKVLYECVAGVDMAISIQSVRDGLPYYCKPEFVNGSESILIKDLYHPLVENCVANSIHMNNSQGILITGSNMSGKTTFIRAIAVNALLAQTINTSFSAAYQAPPLKIFTSIHMSDDMGGHKSYFQAEAISVRDIIRECEASKPIVSLVIIDEIFRGTNTIERIAAAKAVLSHLVENKSFVLVSTHDLELAELLGSDFKVFSFEELIGDNRLVFDYKLKEGLLKNKNGIAVLQGLGFPQNIIEEASAISNQLRAKYDLQISPADRNI